MTPGTTEKPEGPLPRRLGWFALLYLAGLIVVGGLTCVLRAVLGIVFPS